MLLGFAGMGALLFTDKHFPNAQLYRMICNVVMFGSLIAFNFTTMKPKYAVEPETVESEGEKLRACVEEVSSMYGIPAPRSRVLTEVIYGKYAALLDGKGVGVTLGALEDLSPGEVKFLVAHELAPQKLKHLVVRRFLFLGPILLASPMMAVILAGKSLALVPPPTLLAPC